MGPKSTSVGAGTGTGGEIVQVQGGHILRATGRKDRHSKVFTAKGARDRRVRLAAHTAIQFYDVQDRLGYDRPSKAVDWLINKAKASIDKLNELPPWDPTTFHRHALNNNNICSNNNNNNNNNNNENVDVDVNNDDNNDNVGSFSKQVSLGSGSGGGDSSTLGGGGVSQFCVPHCVDSSMMKSFFPTHHNTTTTTSSENDSLCFQNYPHELISRETAGHHQAQNLSQSQSQSQNRDLCLSLQTVDHDSGIGGHLGHLHQGQGQGHDQQNLFHQGGFVDGGWAQQQQDMGRLMGGILFNSSPPVVLSPQALLLNQQGLAMTNYFNQRSTLQSSYSALPRVFEDNQHHNHNHNQQQMSSIGHGSDSFMGFYIPSQVHGDLHGGATTMSNRASSSSLSPDSSQH